MSMQSTVRSGFQWNTGGWFGAQLGGTLWILLLAVLLVSKDVWLALTVFAAFLLPNVVGTLLWRARGRIAAYPAIQILLAVCWSPRSSRSSRSSGGAFGTR